MAEKTGLFKKIWNTVKVHVKTFFIFAAFFLLIFPSLVIMNQILDRKLSENVEQTVNDIQAFLSAALLEPEIAINFIADTIQSMILRGESIETIQSYLESCSSDEFKEKIHITSYLSIFVYFDEPDVFFDGAYWQPPYYYKPRERPWYSNAHENDGNVAITQVHTDLRINIPVLFYSRSLFDSDGSVMGVIGMSVPIDSIQQSITGGHFTEGSYGFITDDELIVVVHPEDDLAGYNMSLTNPNLAQAEKLIRQGHDVTMYEFRNYLGQDCLLFSRRIYNGWHINFSVPRAEYYRELNYLSISISLLGLLMAAALSILLFKIDAARYKADMKSRQKSNFLAIMSHEIRTPMNAIMGIAEAQLQDDHDLPQGIKEAFDKIYYSGSLLLQIIGDLLDLSKIESGKLEIVPDKYEVASLINEVMLINKMKFDSRPVEFKLHVDENIPARMIGDELRIKQILNNLLSNAFKYTRKGEIELSITSLKAGNVSYGDSKPDVILVFSVRDTGQGIAPQDIKNLFDEYARFNLQANRATVGTGLGLSITRNLAILMGGEIFVESEVDKGSVFTVKIPQKTYGSSVKLGKMIVDNLHKFQFSSVSEIKKVPILRRQMPDAKVLIVDDVEMNLFVAKLLMRPYGLRIETASSGYEAIDRIKNGSIYDLVFMDHMMPKMDGIEAVKIIRSLDYKHPIVALTANAVAGQADMFLANSFDDFLSKPIDIRLLDSILNKYIHGKETEAGLVGEDTKGKTALLKIDGLDVEKGLELFEGNINDYFEALQSYIKNASSLLLKLGDVTEETLSEFTVNIHGLKSISAWICMEGIRAGAAMLESFSKDGNYAEVMAQKEEFINSVENFLINLKEALANSALVE